MSGTGKSAVAGAYFVMKGESGKTIGAPVGAVCNFGCEEGSAAMSIVPLLAQSAFDPEFIETLVSAYEDAWQELEKSGSTFASPRYRRAAQEIVAKRIIEMAQRGERERTQLAKDAAAYLIRSYA